MKFKIINGVCNHLSISLERHYSKELKNVTEIMFVHLGKTPLLHVFRTRSRWPCFAVKRIERKPGIPSADSIQLRKYEANSYCGCCTATQPLDAAFAATRQFASVTSRHATQHIVRSASDFGQTLNALDIPPSFRQ